MIPWFKNLFDSAGKRRLLVLLGILGILLIGLSEWIGTASSLPDEPTATLTAQQVEQALEQRVTTLLSHIDGVGTCHVMVTLEQGTQQVYASESVSGGDKVLTVTTDNGPVGLRITEIQPIIKGVVVVCDGATDTALRERVSAVIATAFNLSSRRVCVVS